MSTNDGGPAFPQNDATVNRANNHDGMTLRDYFAAKAMQGLIASEGDSWFVDRAANDESCDMRAGAAARAAYAIADAMLREREAR